VTATLQPNPTFGEPRARYPVIHRPSAYALVRNSRGAFAIVRSPRGYFLPGGGIESQETPEQAVVREAMEEAGLRIHVQGIACRATEFVFAEKECASFEKASVFFAARVVQQAEPGESDHFLEWHSRESALAALSPASHRWAVAQCDPGAGT